MKSEQLNEIALAALERSAFVFAEAVDPDDRGSLPGCDAFAIVRVTGALLGELHLGASNGFLRELAASLLGVEPEEVDPGTQGSDALLEMANMIAGSVVVQRDGENRACSLGLPALSTRRAFDAAFAGALRAIVSTNGEPLSIAWVEQAGAAREAA